MRCLLPFLLLALVPTQLLAQRPPQLGTSTTKKNGSASTFANGLPTDPKFFPLAVWLQPPHLAPRYRELGINLYLGLWDGPTAPQLTALEQAGMLTICAQNPVGLAHRGKAIVGWMHGDEPDNAQPGKLGYGPPIPPHDVVADYERLRKTDPTRPVLLNLGQGVAWDGWHGRGPRTNHPEDYPEYAKGCDIASFDIYPVTHDKPAVAGKLEFVGKGVQRLVGWTQGKKPVFACIETTHIQSATLRPTPAQLRSQVWMAITCGADGIVYFAHEWQPKFHEAALLTYPDITKAVQDVNAEVLAVAPVLNSPTLADAVTVTVRGTGTNAGEAAADGEVAVLCKAAGRDLFVFAASLQGTPVQATFTVKGKSSGKVVVQGEQRELKLEGGRFRDEFAGYGIHHYRIAR